MAAGIVAGLAVGVVVAYLLTRPPAHHAATSNRIGNESLGVGFGFTASQVVSAAGQPTEKRSGCWIYRVRNTKVDGIFVGDNIDAVRFCFAGGVVSDREVHVKPVDSHAGFEWLPPVYMSPSYETNVSP